MGICFIFFAKFEGQGQVRGQKRKRSQFNFELGLSSVIVRSNASQKFVSDGAVV